MRFLDFMGRQDPSGHWQKLRVPDSEIAELRKTLEHDAPTVWVRLRSDIDKQPASIKSQNQTYHDQIEKTGSAKFRVATVVKHHKDHAGKDHGFGWIENRFCTVGAEPTRVTLREALLLLARNNTMVEECDEPGTEDETETEDADTSAAPVTRTPPPPRRRR